MFKTVEGRVQYADYVLPFCLLRCPGWYRLLQCKIKTKRFVYVLDLEPRTSRRGRFLNVCSNWCCYPCLWERLHTYLSLKPHFFFRELSSLYKECPLRFPRHETGLLFFDFLIHGNLLSARNQFCSLSKWHGLYWEVFFARHMVTIEFRSLYNWYL